MYDIEFVLPITGGDRYLQRVADFKKFGLMNIRNRKVRLKVLTDKSVPDKIANEGWPEKVDVIVKKYNHPEGNSATPKIYSCYLDYLKESLDDCRWYAKVDDDSINDVDGLVTSLDLDHDHNREDYLVAEPIYDISWERKVLKRVDPSYLRWGRFKRPAHEWEISVFAQRAMKTMFNDQKAVDFLRYRLAVYGGNGDTGMGIMARICKINAAVSVFMSQYPFLPMFSLLGGPLNHIHYMSRDKNPGLMNILEKRMAGDLSRDPLYRMLSCRPWSCLYRDGIRRSVKFSPNGIIYPIDQRIMQLSQVDYTYIGMTDSIPGVFWDTNGKTVVCYDGAGQKTTEFRVRNWRRLSSKEFLLRGLRG